MSRRTADLPPLSGAANLIREIRYSEIYRQGIGILLVAVYGWFGNPEPGLYWAGVVLVAAGVIWRLYASGFIMKNKELATIGPYAVVRHPLYTGNILCLVGMVMAASEWWGVAVGIAFVWLWYPPAIEYEDRKLHKIFGDPWKEWSSRTPALVPRRFSGMGGGSWSLAKSIKQNAEPLVVVWMIFWMFWLAGKLPQ